ncbi:hypothetical protein FACS1894180_7680 [Bacteroidia bacterium]|nr:hypothetical protein FACS1894180_7680 [Bacteroidia bacterium]
MKKSNGIYERNLYVNKIKPFIDKQIIKVLTGHRRVEKSFILYHLMDLIKKSDRTNGKHYLYYNR